MNITYDEASNQAILTIDFYEYRTILDALCAGDLVDRFEPNPTGRHLDLYIQLKHARPWISSEDIEV